MINRTINAPGIEVREIDRSNYDNYTDYSTTGTTTMVLGFADKGENYDIKWINSINTLQSIYGLPKTEPERFFYNACYEVLNKGGVLVTAKLPYKNNSLNKLTYTDYYVDANTLQSTTSPFEVLNHEFAITSLTSLTTITALTSDVTITESLLYRDGYSEITTQWDYEKDIVKFVKETINLGIEKEKVYDEKMSNTDALNKLQEIYQDYESEDPTGGFKDLIKSYFPSFKDLIDSFNKTVNFETIKSYIQNLDKIIANSYSASKQLLPYDLVEYYLTYEVLCPEIKQIDNDLTSFIAINKIDNSGMLDIDSYDKYLIGEKKVEKNIIRFINTVCEKYGKDAYGNEFLGIVPVITTAPNAMYYQEIIDKNENNRDRFIPIDKLINDNNSYWKFKEPINNDSTIIEYEAIPNTIKKQFDGFVQNLGSEKNISINDQSISKTASELFPTIQYVNNKISNQYLKQIGVVVFKLYVDTTSNNKIGFSPLESFVGSLNVNEIDINTGVNVSIQKNINDNSKYIRMFSNIKFASQGEDLTDIDKASFYYLNKENINSMGFYTEDTVKEIEIKTSITDAIDRITSKIHDRNTLDLDLVVDAGISNIAQYIASVSPNLTDKLLSKCEINDFYSAEKSRYFVLKSSEDVKYWKMVVTKLDNFCKNVRKDCMLISDGPRTLCLEGNEKIVRFSKPQNTIKTQILNKMKFISGAINSSYSAGYLNWFKCVDYSNQVEMMWMPPSIKALGVYLYSDNYYNFFSAPAGLNRGVIRDAVDIAFNPSVDEAGTIYLNSWNYAISYPVDGIVLEGQRTFQTKKTALDRVNVRRLMLGLEKTVRDYCKYYNYEQNTEYLRSNLRDKLDSYFESIKMTGGIDDYAIILDETNNTVQTIENNELHITIAVKPVKAIEYIICNLVCTNQSADVTEVAQSEI